MTRNIFGRIVTGTALAASVIVAQPASAQLFELTVAGSVNVRNGPNPLDVLLDFSQFVSTNETTTLPGLVSFQDNPGFFSIGEMNDIVAGDPLLGRPLCVNCPVAPLLRIGLGAGFPNAAAYEFTLLGLTPGTPPADVIFGPIELTSTGTIGTAATASGFGTVTGGIFGAQTRNFTVTFSATFGQDTPAGLVADIVGGGTRDVGFDANFQISAIPEPATVALMGTGLVALLGVGYRRRTNV